MSAKKRYADLVALCDLARLAFTLTDVVVNREGALRPTRGRLGAVILERAGTPIKIRTRTDRKIWRWPDPVDEAERKAELKAFAQRLRTRFPPVSGSNAVATITLTTDSFNFDSVERAFVAVGWVGVVLGALARLNHQTAQPDFYGGDLPLLWTVLDLDRIARLNRIVQADGDEWAAMGSYSGRRLVRIVRGQEDDQVCWTITRATDFFHDFFLPALYGSNLARIRECPICARPFIALRKDRSACSAPCLNTHRQREHRRRSMVYEQHRKENRRRLAKRWK